MADAAAKHGSIRKTPLQSRRRFDEQTEGGATGLFISRMSQQEKWPPRRLRPKIEPAAFRQAERFGIVVDFQNGRGESPARQRRFRQPQSIVQPSRRRMENTMRI